MYKKKKAKNAWANNGIDKKRREWKDEEMAGAKKEKNRYFYFDILLLYLYYSHRSALKS